MKVIPESEVWENRYSYKGFKVLGTVLLLFSVFFIYISFPDGFHSLTHRTYTWQLLAIGFFLGVFGLALFFLRSGITINLREGIVYKWWGIIVPFRRKPYNLKDFNQVYVDRSFVCLINSEEERQMQIDDYRSEEYQKAKSVAIELARFLKLPLAVASSYGAPAVREYEHIGESVRERWIRESEKIQSIPAPSNMKSKIAYESGIYTVFIPRGGFDDRFFEDVKRASIVTVVLLGCVLLNVLVFHKGNFAVIFGSPIGIIFTLIIPFLYFLTTITYAFQKIRIDASKDSLRYQNKGILWTNVEDIPIEKILDIRICFHSYYRTRKTIYLIGDEKCLDLTRASLSNEETEYIYANIKKTIVGVETPDLPPRQASFQSEAELKRSRKRKDNGRVMGIAAVSAFALVVASAIILSINFMGGADKLHYIFGPKIHRAVYKGDLNKVKAVLDKNPKMANKRTNASGNSNYFNDDKSPLHVAVENGRYEVCELLVERGADINACDIKNFTPLAIATDLNDAKIVKLLLERGANANVKTKYNGYTPLHFAVSNGNLQIIEMLIAHKADLKAKDYYNLTPFDLAVKSNKKEVVEYLKEHAAEK